MFKTVTRLLIVLAPTALILVAAHYVLNWVPRLGPDTARWLMYLPYASLTAAALLAWAFNRSRLAHVCLVLALVQLVLDTVPGSITRNTAVGIAAFTLLSVLVPANILLLSMLSERGMFTRYGLLRVAILLGQAAVGALLVIYWPAPLHRFAEVSLVDMAWITQSAIPQIAIVVILLIAIIMLVRLVLDRSAGNAGVLGALAATTLALHFSATPWAPQVYLAASGFLLLVTVIQESHGLAYRDQLTRLPSRRALEDNLPSLGRRFTVAMVDIDHFKKFNDRYGHDVGDDVLRFVAARLERVGGGGKAFRYGGEEFTIVFRRKRLERVLAHLETLREQIQDSRLALRGKDRPAQKPRKKPRSSRAPRKVSVTVSIGVAERSEKARTAREVIKAADQALYRAKRKGRNRVSR